MVVVEVVDVVVVVVVVVVLLGGISGTGELTTRVVLVEGVAIEDVTLATGEAVSEDDDACDMINIRAAPGVLDWKRPVEA